MNVFISWSGNTSKQCANQIREFLIECFGEKLFHLCLPKI